MDRRVLEALGLLVGVLLAQATFAALGFPPRSALSTSQDLTLEPLASPTARIDFTPSNPVVGQAIDFTAAATGGTLPYNYSWDWGDGSAGTGPSTNPSATHTYSQQGTFTVTLNVTDAASNTTFATLELSVPLPLTVSFTLSPFQPIVGQQVAFSSTVAGGTYPFTYSWTFGDAGTSTSANPFHSYQNPGTYTVSLAVTDAVGRNAAAAPQQVSVAAALVASFSFTPTQPLVQQAVSFVGTVTGGIPTYTYAWAFGDGSRSSLQNPSHTYTVAKSYLVFFNVTDSVGNPVSTPGIVTVTSSMTVSFSFSPTHPQANESITFTSVVSGGTTPYTYAWAFGDGGTSTQANPAHSYVAGGTYDVTLTVVDQSLLTTVASETVLVTAPLAANFTFFPMLPAVNQSVAFTSLVTGGTPAYTYSWTFGDGSSGATGATPSHSYKTPGTFTVILTVHDSAGHTVTWSNGITISGGLTADFSSSQPHPVVGENVTLTAVAGGGTPPYAYSWDFGNGSTNTGISVVHAFDAAATFYVLLSVSDSAGHLAPVVNHSFVVKDPITGNFTYSPKLPLTYAVVNFTAVAAFGFPPYSFAWNFGDGSTGSGTRVGHTYSGAGNYTVSVIGSDIANHQFAYAENVTIFYLLAATFSFSPTFAVIGQVVNFTAEAQGANPPYTFNWNFGDATSATGQSVSHAYATSKSFTVTLTVIDAVGRKAVVYESIVVSSGFAASLSVSSTRPVLGQVVSFSGAAAGGSPPYDYTWDFGDGANATGSRTTHAYNATGNYTVNLTVYDSAGHNATDLQMVVVTPLFLANFTITPTAPVDGESIAFNATASGGTPPYIFQWTFGDGGTSVGANVSHAYGSPRTYTVALVIADSARHSIPITRSLYVRPSIHATITYSPDRPLLGQLVSFVANASGGAGNYTYSWDFGDGKFAKGAEVNHTFGGLGFATDLVVTLTVCDSANRCSEFSRKITLDSVFSVALLGEGAFAAVVLGYWTFERRRRSGSRE